MTARPAVAPPAAGFAPRIEVGCPVARLWLAEATLRLRREVAWLWHLRGSLQGLPGGGVLPPAIDPLHDALDLTRYDADRLAFLAADPAAAYLGARIAALHAAPRATAAPPRGGFGWLAAEMRLSAAECLVLALALGGAVDGARGAVIAACLNAPEARDPTLALAQRLWDRPDEVLALLDPAHPLVEAGILAPVADWDAPLQVPPAVARQLLFPEAPPPAALVPVAPPVPALDGDDIALTAARLKSRSRMQPVLVPLVGPEDGPHAETAASIAARAGLPLLVARGGGEVGPLLTLAWLRGAALLVPLGRLSGPEGVALPVTGLPVAVFVALTPADRNARLPRDQTLARVVLPALDQAARVQVWRRALPELWAGEAGQALLAEAAHRFALEDRAIRRIAAALAALDRPIDRDTLFAACRADLDLGDLAQPVRPRFRLDELMLPPRPAGQIRALIRALGALGRVHMDWGLGRAWNDSGLSVLFAGPPGTGKTMAAEAIAAEVGMPIYRIDLSQVVNKYIGETEKNLSRLFDAADSGDAILFFDEADALFGKRTEVKDAHDRYANLEVSYLLERMERFRGMAILASNRRKDLDEAFLRRLRAIVAFPLPEAAERLRIWRAVLPQGVDCSGLDLAFLADRLPLAGGHIRSAVFNACLQSARPGEPPRLEMAAVVRAVKDEFDKLGRTVSLDQFGAHAGELHDGA
ncbi:MAG: ATP-binding protein [Fuscovulum sp.]|nr:ATP-binding protein [Fuscovulum sp.]